MIFSSSAIKCFVQKGWGEALVVICRRSRGKLLQTLTVLSTAPPRFLLRYSMPAIFGLASIGAITRLNCSRKKDRVSAILIP